MSSLERAKAFAKRSVLPAAMTIMPLALAALNANAAAVTLTPGVYSLTDAVTNLGAEVSAYSFLPVTVGDVDGQKLLGNGLYFVLNSNLNSVQAVPNLTITGQGTGSGTFTGDAVGVKWDFTLTELGLVTCDLQCALVSNAIDWTLNFNLGHSGGTANFNTSGSGFGQFTGTGAITGLAGISPQTWSVILSINYTGLSGFTVDIPANSLAIPGQLAAIPEPGTVALMGAGFAVLAIRRMRRS